MAEDNKEYMSLNDVLDALEIEGWDRFLTKEALRNLLGLKIKRESNEEVIPQSQLTFAARYIINNHDYIGIRLDPAKVEQLRKKYGLEQTTLHGPAMPSAIAMIAPQEAAQSPKNGKLSQDEVNTLLRETAAEKSADPTAAPESIPSTAYGESDSYKETAEKGNEWEDILDTRVKDEPVNESKSRPGYNLLNRLPRYSTEISQGKPKLSGLQAELAAQSDSTRLMRDMITQEENERDIQQETHKAEKQFSAAKPYQPVQKMMFREEAIDIIKYILEENAIPKETVESIALACFGVYAVRVYGLEELTEPQGSVDTQKLKEALEGFLTDFFSFSKSRDPSILDVERFRTRKMYVREFDNTMVDFVKSLG